MKKVFIIFFCSACYLVAAGAQEFYTTETQLQKLEAICQSYKQSNAKLQQQLNSSQQELQKLKASSQELKTRLQNERNVTASLSRSLTKFEDNAAKSEAEKIQLLQEIAQRDQRIGKYKLACVTLTATAIILLLVIAAGVYIRLRRIKLV